MAMYRIKTEQEFINEFGDNWRRGIDWVSDMDELFGFVLDLQEKDFRTNSRGRYFISRTGWTIHANMYLPVDEIISLAHQYAKVDVQIQPQVKLNDSLFR